MAAITAAVIGGGAALYSAKKQSDTGKELQQNELAAGRQQAQGIRGAAAAMTPMLQEAAKVRAQAAQRAADLEAAGLGDARQIYRDIVSGTYDVLSGFAPSSLSGNGSPQQRGARAALETAQQEFAQNLQSGQQQFGTDYVQAVQPQSGADPYEEAIQMGRQYLDGADDDGFRGFQSGTEAFRMQLAMTGALGPEAQQTFYENYQNSPKVKYQLEQIGRLAGSGSSGGNRLRALQELIAFNDDNYFNQLGNQADRSQRFSERAADLRMNQAETELGLSSLGTQIESNLARELGGIEADQLTTEAGLRGEEISGTANTLSSASMRGSEARAAGGLAATNTLMGGLKDFSLAAGDIWGDDGYSAPVETATPTPAVNFNTNYIPPTLRAWK